MDKPPIDFSPIISPPPESRIARGCGNVVWGMAFAAIGLLFVALMLQAWGWLR